MGLTQRMTDWHMTDEVIRELFLIACQYLRDNEHNGYSGENNVHDGILWDMAGDQAKALNALLNATD